MDIASEYPRGKPNSWQDLVEHVIESVECDLNKFKTKGKLDCKDIVPKMIQHCEDRKPGTFLRKIVSKILNHIYSVLDIYFQHVKTEDETLIRSSEQIAYAYHKALKIILSSEIYSKKFKEKTFVKFLRLCMPLDVRFISPFSSLLFYQVIASFPYDKFLLQSNAMCVEYGKENKFTCDFEFIFYVCSKWFGYIENKSRNNNNRSHSNLSNHTVVMDISNNFLETLNSLLKTYDLNAIRSLLSIGDKHVFTYAKFHITDSSESLRKASLNYLMNYFKIIRRMTNWNDIQTHEVLQKQNSDDRNKKLYNSVRDLYEILVRDNSLSTYLTQANIQTVASCDGQLDYSKKQTVDQHLELAADIIIVYDMLINKYESTVMLSNNPNIEFNNGSSSSGKRVYATATTTSTTSTTTTTTAISTTTTTTIRMLLLIRIKDEKWTKEVIKKKIAAMME